jgi:phenylacetate-CoA ligase
VRARSIYRQIYQVARRVQPGKSVVAAFEEELERNQWLDREEVQRISWDKLKRLLEHAFENVPYYRRRFDELGLTPKDIRTKQDLRQLPLLTKEDVRENMDALIARGYSRETMKRVVTSGSSGVPFIVYQDREFETANIAAYIRARRWFDWEFGDKVAWVWGRRGDISHNWQEKLIYRLKRERWMDGFRPTRQAVRDFVEMLIDWKPDLIAGYANVISLLAAYVLEREISSIRPKLVESTAMQLLSHDRQRIEEAFRCPVTDRYGSHETGSIVAYQCPEQSRHIFSDLVFFEVLMDGQPVSTGEVGEVVLTPLHAYGMPLIRFRIGDIARATDDVCACGRGLPVVGDIEGRITGIFTLPSGRLLYGGAFRHLVLKDSTAIQRFRVHQYAPDKIEVSLERGRKFDESMVDLVRARCMALIGDEPIEFTIKVVDEISTTDGGKHLVTTSDVPVKLN